MAFSCQGVTPVPLLLPLALLSLLIYLFIVGEIFSVATTISVIGFLWIMFFRPRQMSVLWKWLWIIPILLLVALDVYFMVNKTIEAELLLFLLLLFLLLPFWVLLLWNMVKRISRLQSSGYYSYELRRQHDKRIGWRLALLCGVITVILLGGFIYKYAHDLNTFHLLIIIMFVSIGSILIIMTGRFLNLFQKAQEKLMSIVVSIALVILFSAIFSLLLAGLSAGSSKIEEWYYDFSIEKFLVSHFIVQQDKYQDKYQDFKEIDDLIEQFKEALKKEALKNDAFKNEDKKYKDLIDAKKELLKREEWQEMPDIINKVNHPRSNLLKFLFDFFDLLVHHESKKDDTNEINKWKSSVKNLSEYQKACSPDKINSSIINIIKEIYCNPFFDRDIFEKFLEDINKEKEKFASSTITISVGIIMVIMLIMGLFINLNYNSLHYFYRTRLSNTYLIKRRKKDGEKEEEIIENKELSLKDIHDSYNGPYHLINTTLNVPSSTEPALSGRGADFFIFSKYYCGAESTGYRRTKCYDGGYTKLATAMAISGAAASPEMGTSTNPGMAALMTLLNIRLNRWMLNPNRQQGPKIIIWPYYLFKELLRKSEENDTLLNLSDGGHHENLGVYPLLKRRCKLIIASDAGADPNYQMKDLANLQRKARIDLGINIEIDLMDLRPDDKTRYTKAYFVKGTIHYPGGEQGTLFYLKTTMTGNEPEDLLGYQRKHPDFPDETTADQFFNEDQFESYRKLGEWIGERFYFETVVEKDKQTDIGLGIFAINAQKLKAIVESLKIDDLENIIVNMENPVTFYPQREEEAGLGEPFLNLVRKFVTEDRSHLVETIREWLRRKNHQYLLWFAGEVVGYFKLSELRDKLRPFCRIMDEPDKERYDWELSCLWAYARFNDYEQIHELLHKTTNPKIQKWLLTVYIQMVTTHPKEGKHQCFIDEVNKFLEREIQDHVKREAQDVVKQLEIQKAIYELLQKIEDEETQKWLLTFYTRKMTASPEECQDFIDELNQFLQCSGIPNDVTKQIKQVIELLENISRTGEPN